MKQQRTYSLALLLALVCAVVASAAAPAKKEPAKKASVRPAAASSKKSSVKSTRQGTRQRTPQGSTGRRTVVGRKSVPAGPPRQNTPTAERYMQIQQALAERGFYNGQVDGTWNAASVEALRRFQADQNLAVDGKLGALSLISLGLGPKRQAMQMPAAAGPDQRLNP